MMCYLLSPESGNMTGAPTPPTAAGPPTDPARLPRPNLEETPWTAETC
jgi:hypothetical protein